MSKFNKICVIGCPGSGKSYLSLKLSQILNIPVFHLDNYYWNKDKTNNTSNYLIEKITSIVTNDQWIIDGNYLQTMDLRIKYADTVIFLDMPTKVCIDSVVNRVGKVRVDIPWVEESIDEEFMQYIQSFNQSQRLQIIQLLSKYTSLNIITFTSRKQVDDYLNELKNINDSTVHIK